MRRRSIGLFAAGCAALLFAAEARCASEASEPNTWTKLPVGTNGHWGNPIVYCPARKQLLHYNAYEVKAFDAANGTWSADYAWPGEKGYGIPAHDQNKGVSYHGTGSMTPGGFPSPGLTVNGAAWDGKRARLLLMMHGLLAAYDPASRKWEDLKARTEFGGNTLDGAPRVYGSSVEYDPVNDEVLLFGHWGGYNTDWVEVTGESSGHFGTIVYSFKDNLFRRACETLGRSDVQAARGALRDKLGVLSGALDELYLLRRVSDAERRTSVAAVLKDLAGKVAELSVPAETKGTLAEPAAAISQAADLAVAGKPAEALAKGAEALRALMRLRDGPLAVEPPARCGTPLLYVPSKKAIYMFGGMTGIRRTDLTPAEHHGGQPGALNDTWKYDCKAKQWSDLSKENRPPATLWPQLFHDPASNRLVLVQIASKWGGAEAKATLWTFDLDKEAWSVAGTQALPGDVGFGAWTGWGTPTYVVGYDPERRLALIETKCGPYKKEAPVTYALTFDASKLEEKPAPAWKEPPPMVPHPLPPDDADWVAKLKALPANAWMPAAPKGTVCDRGWGIAACDPVRGHVYYFGGGHSTYQGREVAIYVTGANAWTHGMGGHNDHVPPVGWGGAALSYLGEPNAHHQRNTYTALDGRLYANVGTASLRWAPEAGKAEGPRYLHFYDVDRGGLWRRQRIDNVKRVTPEAGTFGQPHLQTAEGIVYSLGGVLEPYDGRMTPSEAYVSAVDTYGRTIESRKLAAPIPGPTPECRPFCYASAQKAILIVEINGKINRTWLYEIEKGAFRELKPARSLPECPLTLEYLDGQNAAWAPTPKNGEWVYSFEHNTWAPLKTQGKTAFSAPYAQSVYVAKYGVLVNLPHTEVMRPHVGGVKWSE